jgi:hypothetical protein
LAFNSFVRNAGESMSNLKAAQDVHHKFEFYIVALAFTTAAFAMQTGEFTGLIPADVIEALAWSLLVLSGVIGLMRLEYLPVAYRVHDYVAVRQESIREHEADEEQQENVAALRELVADTEPKLRDIEDKNQSRYGWQMRLLVAGFGVLLVARLIAQVVEHY